MGTDNRFMILSHRRERFTMGVVGGLLGGLLMAIFSMSMGVLRGPGPWMSAKLIGGVVLGPRAINNVGVFDFTPIISGLVIHFIVAAVLGGLFGLFSVYLPSVSHVLWGMVYGLLIWFVASFFVLPVIDPLLVNNTDPGLFALSHIIYGVSLGWWMGTHVP